MPIDTFEYFQFTPFDIQYEVIHMIDMGFAQDMC